MGRRPCCFRVRNLVLLLSRLLVWGAQARAAFELRQAQAREQAAAADDDGEEVEDAEEAEDEGEDGNEDEWEEEGREGEEGHKDEPVADEEGMRTAARAGVGVDTAADEKVLMDGQATDNRAGGGLAAEIVGAGVEDDEEEGKDATRSDVVDEYGRRRQAGGAAGGAEDDVQDGSGAPCAGAADSKSRSAQ